MTPLSTGSTKLQISDEVGFQEMFRACLLWVVDLFGGAYNYTPVVHIILFWGLLLDFIISIFFPPPNTAIKKQKLFLLGFHLDKKKASLACFVVLN